jgi:hypothetical protein
LSSYLWYVSCFMRILYSCITLEATDDTRQHILVCPPKLILNCFRIHLDKAFEFNGGVSAVLVPLRAAALVPHHQRLSVSPFAIANLDVQSRTHRLRLDSIASLRTFALRAHLTEYC